MKSERNGIVCFCICHTIEQIICIMKSERNDIPFLLFCILSHNRINNLYNEKWEKWCPIFVYFVFCHTIEQIICIMKSERNDIPFLLFCILSHNRINNLYNEEWEKWYVIILYVLFSLTIE
jgi:hypothetical protein